MGLNSETRQPVQVERKTSTIKAKAKEIVKKVIPEKTRQWLIQAGEKLKHKNGRQALETLATPPPQILEKENKKDI